MHRAAGVVEHGHLGVEVRQRGQHAVHPLFAVGFHPQRVAVEDQGRADSLHALGGDVLKPARRLVTVDPVIGVVEGGRHPGRVPHAGGGLADRERIALGIGQRGRGESAAQVRHQFHRVGPGVEQVDQPSRSCNWTGSSPPKNCIVSPGHDSCAEQLPGLQLTAGCSFAYFVCVAGAHVAHGDALTGVHCSTSNTDRSTRSHCSASSRSSSGSSDPRICRKSSNAPPSNSTASIGSGSASSRRRRLHRGHRKGRARR